MPSRLLARAALLAASLAVSGHLALADGASLYDRLGGAMKVAAISNDLIDETAAHPALKRSFDGVSVPRVKEMLIEQVCALTGGPCTYSGDTMVDVHAGLDITEAEMNGMVELLRTVMIRHDIRLRERNELLALLAPMKREVVTR